MADKEGNRLNSDAFVMCQFPDVCLTGPNQNPTPYQIFSGFDKSVETAASVNFTGDPAFKSNSYISTSIGNEPGTGGGIVSQVNKGISRPASWSSTVRVEGKNVVRHDDIFLMNCSDPKGNCNTIGKAINIKFSQFAKVNPEDGTIEVKREGVWNDSEGNIYEFDSHEKYDDQGNLLTSKMDLSISRNNNPEFQVCPDGQTLGDDGLLLKCVDEHTFDNNDFGTTIINIPKIQETNPIVKPETKEEKSWFNKLWDTTAEIANELWEDIRELNKTYKFIERGVGVVQVVGSAAEIFLGVVGVLAPEPMTTAAGTVGIAHGVDSATTGLKQIWTGKFEKTLIEENVGAAAEYMGADPGTAENIGTIADMGLGMINPGNIGKNLLKEGGEELAKEAGEKVAKEAGEKLAKEGGEKLAKETGEKLSKEVGETLTKESGEKLAKESGEKLAKEGEEKVLKETEKKLKKTGGKESTKNADGVNITKKDGLEGKKNLKKADDTPDPKKKISEPGEHVDKYNSFTTNADVPTKYTDDLRFESLAKDPGQPNITSKSRQEAMAGLEAESQGVLKGPIERGPTQIEFYDGDGIPWDVKAPRSPSGSDRWSYRNAQAGDSIINELRKNPVSNKKTNIPEKRRVILDISYMKKNHYQALKKYLNQNLTKDELNRIVEVVVDL